MANAGTEATAGKRAPDESTPFFQQDIDARSVRSEKSEKEHIDLVGPVTLALSLCVFFTFSVQSVANTQLLMSSQLDYLAEGPWFFVFVQSVPVIAGTTVCILAGLKDHHYDAAFGVATTMHFRIVVVGAVTMCLAVGIAFVQNGYAQVALGFVCALCAVGAHNAVFQLVAVLRPQWQAAASTSLVLACAVPILSLRAMRVDVNSKWTIRQRVEVFLPCVAFTLVSVVVFAIFWPGEGSWIDEASEERAGEDPETGAPGPRLTLNGETFNPESRPIRMDTRDSTRSSVSEGITVGLRRLSKSEGPASVTIKLPPFPFNLVSLAAFVNGAMYCIQPLITLTPNSGEKAQLIIARFWGEIIGQGLGTALVFIGVSQANNFNVVVFVIVTIARVFAFGRILPLLLTGGLPPLQMFTFRATENVLYCCGTAVVVMASRPSDRKLVARTDMAIHFAGALVGVAIAALIVLFVRH